MSKKNVFTHKELCEKTCKELRNIAKELDISGRWDMNKETLITEIISVQAKCALNGRKEEDCSVDNEKCNRQCNDVKNKSLNFEDRVRTSKIGMLIAFKDIMGKVRTGKIIEKRENSVIARTEYGALFLVRNDDLLWIKTGSRWPRWVYNALKGISESDSKKNQGECKK